MFTVLVVYLLVSGTTWRGAIRRSVMVDICGPCDGSDFDINLDLSNRIGTAGTFDASNLEEWQKVLTLTMEDAADTTTTLSGLNPTTGAFLLRSGREGGGVDGGVSGGGPNWIAWLCQCQ
jgi:hypothetical protein